ncbi:hypothetical protein H671_6g16443 [Cricetulus griseus]|nr:hypothetical protein H671_6g16443 [Cricetulus griseus]
MLGSPEVHATFMGPQGKMSCCQPENLRKPMASKRPPGVTFINYVYGENDLTYYFKRAVKPIRKKYAFQTGMLATGDNHIPVNMDQSSLAALAGLELAI